MNETTNQVLETICRLGGLTVEGDEKQVELWEAVVNLVRRPR